MDSHRVSFYAAQHEQFFPLYLKPQTALPGKISLLSRLPPKIHRSLVTMYRTSVIQAEKNPLGVTVLVLDSLFLFLAAVALAIRITSRKIQGLQLCFNDYAALVAWVLSRTRSGHTY